MNINGKSYELGNKRSVIRELFEYGKKRKAEIGEKNVFDFSLGNPSVKPPEQVGEAIKALISSVDSTELHGYTSAQGALSVRRAVADNINERFSVGITADNIYMTCGAAASLSIVLKALCNNGDEVIAFAPFFTEYRVFTENANAKLIVSEPEKNTFQIDIADFESKITENTKAVIMNSPNNPSGVVYTEEVIKAVCEILKQKSEKFGNIIYLISDEPYRELVYDGLKVPYIMNYYSNSFVCYSFSKSLSLPGERIGYIAVNPNADESKKLYLAVCGAGRSLGYVCAPSLFQRVAEKCINAKVNLSAYKENRDILYNSLTEMGYKCVKPDGAFYLFVEALEADALKFSEKAKSFEILVVPCNDFGVKGYVRIAYCVEKSTITNSLSKFRELFESYTKA